MRRIGVLLPASPMTRIIRPCSVRWTSLARLGWNIGSKHTGRHPLGQGDYEQLRRRCENWSLQAGCPVASSSIAVGCATRKPPRGANRVCSRVDLSAKVCASLSHPGGNTNRLHQFDTASSGKWRELIKEIRIQDKSCSSFEEKASTAEMECCQPCNRRRVRAECKLRR